MQEDASLRIVDVLSEDQLRDLCARGKPVTHLPDEMIFREGQPSYSVLIIQRGNVKVTATASDGTEVILAIRGVDEIIGDEGVLMEEVRSATMTAITEVAGLAIGADKLLEFVAEHQLWPVMYRAAVRRRRQSDQRALLGRLDVKSRLARWLLELATEVGEETADGWVIESTLSQQDMAGRIGASRDAVAIEFRKLREQKLVSTARRRLVLHDLGALRKLATS
jgi:CRP/FNR family transcriptional regulator, cyclic AMP receptor protein